MKIWKFPYWYWCLSIFPLGVFRLGPRSWKLHGGGDPEWRGTIVIIVIVITIIIMIGCHHYHHYNCHHHHHYDCHHRHHYQQFWMKVREVEVTEDEAHSSQMPVIFIIINTIFITITIVTIITITAIFITIKASIAIVTTVDIFIISTVFIIITLLIILTFLTIVKIATLIVTRWFFRVSPIHYDKWIN